MEPQKTMEEMQREFAEISMRTSLDAVKELERLRDPARPVNRPWFPWLVTWLAVAAGACGSLTPSPGAGPQSQRLDESLIHGERT